jgi:hypothetical protein
MTRFLLAGLAVLFVASVAEAQPSRVDLSVSFGRVLFGEPRTDVGTIGAGACVWITDSFGVAWSMDVGSDMVSYNRLVEPVFPLNRGDRKVTERGNVRLHRVTARYRRPLWSSAHIVLGGGVVAVRMDERYLVARTLTDIEQGLDSGRWSGPSFESMLRQRLVGRLAIEGGLIVEGALDRGHFHPVVHLTYGF